jgi:hypothetical protein
MPVTRGLHSACKRRGRGNCRTIHLPAVDVPLSPMMSPAVRQRFVDEALHPYEFDMSGDIARERESVDG